ncbi:MAG TPA: HPF/RaiA family ribosome-associated protein [Jatrophihabitans sp.]|jgi:ribosome-associated translation inhibitor RaiA|nr:HPF/RaiA family ribosome-associated protein [Jatrophihabitans sp.]
MTTSTSAPYVQLQTQGTVPAADVTYLHAKVAVVLRQAHEPVLFVRAKLAVLPDPAVTRPAIAQVNVDLNGRVLRAQAAQPTLREAIDDVQDRLHERLQRTARNWPAIRGGRPLPEQQEWRHTSVPAVRPPHFPLPDDEREIVRHKSFGLRRMTVDEAAFDMESLGYQFHLFTEAGTGLDSVLYLVDDDPAYRLSQLVPRPDEVTAGAEWASVSMRRPPTLRVEQAVERLNLSGWPFVFFQDAATKRGFVLYHRYDGNYGLITPRE